MRSVFACSLALLACSLSISVSAQAAGSPLATNALWVRAVAVQRTPQQLAGEAAQGGVHALFVKAADGAAQETQFSPSLVGGLRAAGMSVCAWTFAYGEDPQGEARAALAAVANGAQCLVVDAEGQYDGRYGAAQLFVRTLRAKLGRAFPIGLAGQAEAAEHPTFPYSVFLGPGGFGFDLPQVYWRDLGVGVDAAFTQTMSENAVYGRPILPVGQLYGEPPVGEVTRFRALAAAFGAPGWSFFDLDGAQPTTLASLGTPPPRLGRRRAPFPTLRAGADGDQVVWAQEHLNAAGARLPVGGFYGARTSRAVAQFQRRHRLPANGELTPATWRALLRLRPREPSWALAPPQSAAQAAP
ncbi:MAG TPA: peptidoglycan-binding domain-containing protein [Solirubrobacteraceae bacterium]|jgi:hypothetical protein